MTRFRVTIRGEGVELRGYVDNYLPGIARVMEPYGLVIASPAEDDYDPFAEPVVPPPVEREAEEAHEYESPRGVAGPILECAVCGELRSAAIHRG